PIEAAPERSLGLGPPLAGCVGYDLSRVQFADDALGVLHARDERLDLCERARLGVREHAHDGLGRLQRRDARLQARADLDLEPSANGQHLEERDAIRLVDHDAHRFGLIRSSVYSSVAMMLKPSRFSLDATTLGTTRVAVVCSPSIPYGSIA